MVVNHDLFLRSKANLGYWLNSQKDDPFYELFKARKILTKMMDKLINELFVELWCIASEQTSDAYR